MRKTMHRPGVMIDFGSESDIGVTISLRDELCLPGISCAQAVVQSPTKQLEGEYASVPQSLLVEAEDEELEEMHCC